MATTLSTAARRLAGRLLGTALVLGGLACGPGAAAVPAQGVGVAVLQDGEPAQNTEFVRHLQGGPAQAGRFTVSVGANAARAAIERPGNEPVVLTLLTRLEFESLKALPAWQRADRRIGVLLRDPAMAAQLAVVEAVLPRKRRLGVIATVESEPLLRELRSAAQGWDLRVEYAPDAQSLAAVLRTLLPGSDALMVLPDLIGDDQAATLAVLRAAAAAGVPVFGACDGLVRSGGLAAAVSTPPQLARQAQALGRKIAAASSPPSGQAALVETAAVSTVKVNASVARALGLRLPGERELTERVTAAR